MNSGVRDHSTSLEPLYDLENKIPSSFPRMVGDIRRLNSEYSFWFSGRQLSRGSVLIRNCIFLAAGVNSLLTLYGIPIRGTIAMKKRRFALFIGLTLDIDF